MIPFCKTTLGKEEKRAITKVIDSGWVVMGKKTQEFEEQFSKYVGAEYSVFVDSGTSALLLAMEWLTQNAKGEFSVPSLTFTATAEVIINSGNTPVFEDVDINTLLMESLYIDGPSLPVHLLGNKSGIDAMIYDSAHRIEKDDLKGVPAALYCYSFYATKNMTTVQGGMVATNNKKAYEWIKLARDHGLDMGTKERYQGKYKQYEVQFVGFREKSDDIHAAIGIEQLKKLPWMTERRNKLLEYYNRLLGLNRTGNHVYYVLVDKRDRFMQYMFDKGIQCTVHFKPLHLMKGYRKYWRNELPNTEYLGDRLVSLPLYPDMTNEQVNYVAKAVRDSNLLINE